MRRRTFAAFALTVFATGLAPQAQAGIISAMQYTDASAFSTATGATSLTGPLPNPGNVGTSVTLGDATLSAGNTIFVGEGWSTLLPNDRAVAISGKENLDVAIETGLSTAFGFYFHEPADSTAQLDGCNATCVDSTFKIEFRRGGALIDDISFEPTDKAAIFQGIVLDTAFDEVRFTETIGGIDNEFFGEMFVTKVPVPATLSFLVLGLLGVGLLGRRRAG